MLRKKQRTVLKIKRKNKAKERLQNCGQILNLQHIRPVRHNAVPRTDTTQSCRESVVPTVSVYQHSHCGCFELCGGGAAAGRGGIEAGVTKRMFSLLFWLFIPITTVDGTLGI